jgi:hypothetical protein
MYWNTVNERIRGTLENIMAEPIFAPFRLVGGTSLSLQIGHRKSMDIDLFTDESYGSIDFSQIENWFRSNYGYVELNKGAPMAMGGAYFVGSNADDLVKVDVYYNEKFIRPVFLQEGIRMAVKEEIVAMKLDIIGRGIGKGGRKKDFWDLHAARDFFAIPEMLRFYQERYPYGHDIEEISKGLTDFSVADDDFDPICLKGKHWELIKLDFMDWMEREGLP